MLAVAMVMAAMMVAGAMPAMASQGESASGEKVCDAPGIKHAHEDAVPEGNEGPGAAGTHTMTAHDNIPCGDMF
jgi:hypothetical protein